MKVLITGGAGFIGVHTARHFAKSHTVQIVDNLSRRGASSNLDWLKTEAKFGFAEIDIRDSKSLEEEFAKFKPDVVIHLAAQVAVTTSVQDPRTDFDINALGTFNVLEGVRAAQPKGAGKKIAVLYSSTNKVYGGME